MTLFKPLAKTLMAALAGTFAAADVEAHEFWIDPEDYTVDVGDRIEARLRNGDDFKGSAYPFLTNWFTSFTIHTRSGAAPVPGRNGDNPAVDVEAEGGGLHILAYDGAINRLTYETWDKFQVFIEHLEQ